jgi:hypothetical protein
MLCESQSNEKARLAPGPISVDLFIVMTVAKTDGSAWTFRGFVCTIPKQACCLLEYPAVKHLPLLVLKSNEPGSVYDSCSIIFFVGYI